MPPARQRAVATCLLQHRAAAETVFHALRDARDVGKGEEGGVGYTVGRSYGYTVIRSYGYTAIASVSAINFNPNLNPNLNLNPKPKI